MLRRNGGRAEGVDAYRAAVARILALDIEVVAPCHGDVIKGASLCKELLREHFSLD